MKLYCIGLFATLLAAPFVGELRPAVRLRTFEPRPSASAPSRIALLVGIRAYDQGTNSADGFGKLETMRDLVNIQRVLQDHYRFADFKVLPEEDATQEGIVAAFRSQLIAKAKPGDSVVFYFTGHGFQAYNEPNGDYEPDGLDETLVTWVPKSKQSLRKEEREAVMHMRDDVIHRLLAELAASMKGDDGKVQGSITVILDSCHSGTGTKGALIRKGRPWDEAIDGPLPKGKPEETDGGGWTGEASLPENTVVISGCRSGQLANMMPDAGNRAENGSVLTYYLTHALADAAARNMQDFSYRDIFEWVKARTLGLHADQDPQLEGPIDSLLFGDGKLKGVGNFFSVTRSVGTTSIEVTLAAGSMMGLTPGSKLALYRRGSDVAKPEGKLADATIKTVEPFSAVAMVDPGSAKGVSADDLVASRAVLTQFSSPPQPLRVLVDSADPLAKSLQAEPFVKTEGISASDFDLRIFPKGNNRILQRKGGGTVTLATDDSDTLRKMLLGEWRWQELARLTAPPTSPTVDIQLVVAPAGTRFEPGDPIPSNFELAKTTKGGDYLLELGDRVFVVCRNRSRLPMFVTLIYLKADGSIQVWPGRDRQFSQPEIPAGAGGKVFHMLVPLRATTLTNDKPPYDRELIKIVATHSPVDFSGVEYTVEQRPTHKSAGHPLQKLLFGLHDGNAKGGDFETDTSDPWGVSDLVLLTRPKS